MEPSGAFVGRIQQRAQLARWLAAARDGQPSVVLLEGPPGIGKSALLAWMIAHAETQRVPALHVEVSDLGVVSTTPSSGHEWGLGLAEQLLGGGGTRLVVVDDAHSLDDAGLRVVEHLAFRLGTASLTGQPARVCLVAVIRDGHQHFAGRLHEEPITRRLLLPPLDDREIRELARQRAPIGSDARAVARLAQLSGGNPLTLHALSSSPSSARSASDSGSVPVEVAWRARLAALQSPARRAAAVIALLEALIVDKGRRRKTARRFRRRPRRAAGASVRWCLPVTAGRLPIRCFAPRRSTSSKPTSCSPSPGPCSMTSPICPRPDEPRWFGCPRRPAGPAPTAHRGYVGQASDEAWEAHSWSLSADFAEFMVSTAGDDRDRAEWLERAGKARFNELDRDEATARLVEAAEALEVCAARAETAEGRAVWRARRAECLLLALRADFTRRGPRRRPELDAEVERLIGDDELDPRWRAQAASILAESSFITPAHDRRRFLVDAGQHHAARSDDTLTRFFSDFAAGLHHFAVLDLTEADRWFAESHRAAAGGGHGWWQSGASARRAVIALGRGDPMGSIAHASVAADEATRWGNWAEHGQALAVRASAHTRLGRFADADTDGESALLSARRADAAFVRVRDDPDVDLAARRAWRLRRCGRDDRDR